MAKTHTKRKPTLRTNESTAARRPEGESQHQANLHYGPTKPPPGGETNTEPEKRTNETTANAEQPEPKATHKTQPQPITNPRNMRESHDSIGSGPPATPGD